MKIWLVEGKSTSRPEPWSPVYGQAYAVKEQADAARDQHTKHNGAWYVYRVSAFVRIEESN